MSLTRKEAGREAAWRWALHRATVGFERGAGEATPDRLRAAAKLELDVALGCPKPAAVCALLDAVYAGLVDVVLLESGRVHVWTTAGARELPDGSPRRTAS
ncbi:MAG TPA: hypothetical protein VMH82_06915 [Myxococcota bacterium]|nr:hypothetical protein [Myxococcota bacterium]